MAPPSLADFTAQLRACSATERAAFVADLLAARGWTVERDGRWVLATADGYAKHVHVGAVPGDVDRVPDDVVVVPSRLGHVLARLPGSVGVTRPDRYPSGTTVLGPAELHEQLCHAIDRTDAERLYRTHFGTSFDREREPDHSSGLGISQRGIAAATLLAVLVAAMFVTTAGGPWTGLGSFPDGGAGGVDGSAQVTDPGPAGGVTPIPDGTVPNVTAADVRDVDTLARLHRQAIDGYPIRMSVTLRGPRFLTGFGTSRSAFDPQDEATVRACVASENRYYVVQRTDFAGTDVMSTNATVERFADGTREYRRVQRNGTVQYGSQSLPSARGGHTTVQQVTRPLLSRYLNTTERQVERLRTGLDTRYRLVATGAPRGLDHPVRDYRAVALVRPDGLLTDLDVAYVHRGTESLVQVSASYDRSCTQVDSPEWYDEIQNTTVADS